MKKITSSTQIKFLLRGTEPLHIDEVGVIVSDEDALILVDRLGGNINVTDTNEVNETTTDALDYAAEQAKTVEVPVKPSVPVDVASTEVVNP